MSPSPLRPRFRRHLEAFHSSHAYTRDFVHLAQALETRVLLSHRESCVLRSSVGRVMVVQTHEATARGIRHLPLGRILFSAMHELSHLLFRQAEGGALLTLLAERYPDRKLRTAALERLVNDGAARLLMPDSLLTPALRVHGFSPKAVLELSAVSGASHIAALRRVMEASTLEVWASLLRIVRRTVGAQHFQAGEWVYSRYHGPKAQYLSAYGWPLPAGHALLEGDPEEVTLELSGGPWADLRPCSSARTGNQWFTRVCVFSFPDLETRTLALREARDSS